MQALQCGQGTSLPVGIIGDVGLPVPRPSRLRIRCPGQPSRGVNQSSSGVGASTSLLPCATKPMAGGLPAESDVERSVAPRTTASASAITPRTTESAWAITPRSVPVVPASMRFIPDTSERPMRPR